MKKPSPPAYAIGMDPDDYSWDNHRYVECEEGGCGIPLSIEKNNPTTGEHTMAPTAKKIVKPAAGTASTSAKPSAKNSEGSAANKADKKNDKNAKKAVKEEVEETSRKPKFAATIVDLISEQDKTDEEIAEILAEIFPDKPDLLGSIKWYRSAHNRKAAQAGEDELEEIVVDDNGKKVPKSKKAPVEKASKKNAESTTAPKASAKDAKAGKSDASKAPAKLPAKKFGKK